MRILRSANLTIVGMVILMAWVLSCNLAIADEIENLVIGGDFEEDADLTHWTVNGDATIEIDDETAAVGDASLFFEINGLDPDKAWQPQFRQVPWATAMMVEKGKTYTFSVFLKAESNRDIQILVFYDPGDVRVIDEWQPIGTEWEEYSFTAEWPESTLMGIRFVNAGAGKISYWVDGIRFYEGEYVPTELNGAQKAVVTPRSKLATTWGEVKARY